MPQINIPNLQKFDSSALWTRQMVRKGSSLAFFGLSAFALAVALNLAPRQASAAPTAEVAKRCLHYAYIAHPFRRPGAAPANGDREAYFRDCLNKDGEVPEPKPPPKSS